MTCYCRNRWHLFGEHSGGLACTTHCLKKVLTRCSLIGIHLSITHTHSLVVMYKHDSYSLFGVLSAIESRRDDNEFVVSGTCDIFAIAVAGSCLIMLKLKHRVVQNKQQFSGYIRAKLSTRNEWNKRHIYYVLIYTYSCKCCKKKI